MKGLDSKGSGEPQKIWGCREEKPYGENIKWPYVSWTISAENSYCAEDENDGIGSVGKEHFQEVIAVIQRKDQNSGSCNINPSELS